MNAQQPKEMTFLDLIKILVIYKWLMLAVFISVQVGGVIYSYTATPVYSAKVIFAVAKKGASAGGGMSSIMSQLSGGGGLGLMAKQRDKVAQGIATLESEQFMREFITEINLLPILYAGRWDSKTSDWKASTADSKPRLSDGSRKLNQIVMIDENTKSGLIELQVNWTDPVLAAKWANKLIFKLNEKLRAGAILEAGETIDFLKKEVEKTRIVELQQAIYFMIEEQINIQTMANIRQEYAFKVISPAIAPELDQYVSPQRVLIFIGALLGGVILSVLSSWLLFGIQHLRKELGN
jgi:uncharacterized protein involved in exopolysaccharide biosynthesis